MRVLKILCWIFPLIAVATQCSQKNKAENWTDGMKGMAHSFDQLLPYIYNSDRFSDPKNSKFIDSKIKELIYYSNSLDHHIANQLSGADPLFTHGLQGIQRTIERAGESFYVQSYDYSQRMLNYTFNYCVQCHSNTTMGRTIQPYNKVDSFASNGFLSKNELAKFQIATRQFDGAIDTLKSELNARGTNESEKMNALKSIVTIYIVNLKSPLEALKTIEAAQKQQSIATKRDVLKKWASDFKVWNQKYAQTPYSEVLKTRRDSKKDSSFMVNIYRNLIFHQALKTVSDKNERAKILFALGENYVDAPLRISELPDFYFETCIYESPNSPVAKRCYFSLEQQIKGALKLESGERLPPKQESYLVRLKAMADLKPSTESSIRGHDSL